MSTSAKSSSKKPRSFFSRLNARYPWLKIIAFLYLSFIVILDLLGLTISRTDNLSDDFPTTPMSKHVKATDRVLKDKKLVALTFDDGPSSTTTPELLDILRDKNALATFFVLGNMANNNPDIVKRAEREGHEIESHTMYHQNLIRTSYEGIKNDIGEAKSVLSSILKHPPTLTRPPYGNYDDRVFELTGTPLILWSVDTEDWKSRDAASVVAIVTQQAYDGAIILLHDIYPSTVEAIPAIIDNLRANGFELVTVSELADNRHIKLSAGESYYGF